MQVGLHILENEVEISWVVGLDDPLEFDDVDVFELMQDGHLSVGSLRVYIILKGVENFLESVFFSRLFVNNLPDVAVGATA